jgi:hypothetical protein
MSYHCTIWYLVVYTNLVHVVLCTSSRNSCQQIKSNCVCSFAINRRSYWLLLHYSSSAGTHNDRLECGWLISGVVGLGWVGCKISYSMAGRRVYSPCVYIYNKLYGLHSHGKYSLHIKTFVAIDFCLQLWLFVLFKKLCKCHLFFFVTCFTIVSIYFKFDLLFTYL